MTEPHHYNSGRHLRVRHLTEDYVMRDAMIERELNEHTMAAVWKYLKTLAWIHVRGLLAEAPGK
jgi:hypothetical protein